MHPVAFVINLVVESAGHSGIEHPFPPDSLPKVDISVLITGANPDPVQALVFASKYHP
jgi:hypothetical protein